MQPALADHVYHSEIKFVHEELYEHSLKYLWPVVMHCVEWN